MRTFLILLLTCLPCLGQFGGVEQPMFQMTSTTQPYSVTNDPAIAYYWNFQDLSTGTVTSWADRKQNLAWLRYRPDFGPFKNSLGVIFTNVFGKTTVLTNTAIAYASNTVLALIWKGSGLSDTYQGIVKTTNSVVDPNWYARRWSGNQGYFDWGAPANITWAFPVDFSTRQFTFIAWSNTTFRCWTNKVGVAPVLSNSGLWGAAGFRGPGIHQLGGATTLTDSEQYRGSWQEFIVWTNVVDCTALLSNYWEYATNTYAFP